MEFTFDDEQTQMQETARDFFESEDVLELARRQMDGDDVVGDVWPALAEMDYTALTVPVDAGGLGEDVLYLAHLLEEAGRVALPAPFPETMAFAVPLVAELGSKVQRERILPSVSNGERTLSFALYEDGDEPIPRDVQLTAEATDDGYRLDGQKTLVPFGDVVDDVIVAARTNAGTGYEGLSLFVVDPRAADVDGLDTLDRTRQMTTLTFDDVKVGEDALLGDWNRAGSSLRAAIDRYTVASCAMLVGAADRTVDMSVDHATEREQFGQPIGAFQAVKHRIADMWMDAEAARSLTYYAAWALANEDPGARRAVSEAKVFCAEELPGVFGDDILNHGGMGFTWEHDGHLYLKQAKSWQTFLGTPTDHLDRIVDASDITDRVETAPRPR